MNQIRTPVEIHSPAAEYTSRYFDTRFDPSYGTYWAMLRADAPVCFSPPLVASLRECQREIATRVREAISNDAAERIHFQVFGSRIPDVFSLGGDLILFKSLIERRDRAALLRYARETIDLVYSTATGYELPVTTISLVQGQALGGGFECALAAQVVIAERQSRMGLPEVLFNLFPGMGAYQLLCRRMTPVRAEQFILSGRTYTAEELYEMGLVDVLADPGQGEEAVQHYIRMHHRHQRAANSLRRAIQASAPLDYQAMLRIGEVWVDAALQLTPKDFQVLDYLIRAQQQYLQ